MSTDCDTVIEEIRESRRRMSEQSGHDVGKFIDELKQLNGKYAVQIGRFQKLCELGSVEGARTT
ncbi:MAG: hypothetical protein HY706_03445 [Candidatus Hydrogenedentes bacterium]|nr:hypothetical protein [Candidatus Hydrogenedentota bacterium]